MRAHPHAVHLLVVEVEWTTPGAGAAGTVGARPRRRFGQCSHYLAGLAVGAEVSVSVMGSEMHLPADPRAPVVMAGLGTGMAPFRAFVQERAALRSEGRADVGPMTLYFGARFRAKEFLYGDEFLALERAGVVRLRLAFSRDQGDKCYIQHLMARDAAQLRADLRDGGGSFYLCGPTWPEPDVEAAMSAAFAEGRDDAEGRAVVKAMKAQRRYVLEVY